MSCIIKQVKLSSKLIKRCYSSAQLFVPRSEFLPDDQFDFDYYCNKDNFDEIVRNIRLRRSHYLLESLNQAADQQQWMRDHIKLLPNRLHDRWKDTDVKSAEKFDKDQFMIEECGSKPDFKFQAKRAEDLYDNFGILMLGNKGLGLTSGTRSYLLLDDLVDLKNALIDFTLDKLIKKYNFHYVTVPNLVYSETINACGFDVFGDRNPVYRLKDQNSKNNPSEDQSRLKVKYKSNQVCLSGTSEVPLAGLHFGEVLDRDQLPLKYCTLSRCYRKEISFLKKENGIYRVHYFDKIEMFALTDKHRSNEMLDEFMSIQKELFNDLRLPTKVLDMPPHELGNSAACKYDVECWLPGRDLYGEISSASNCTDYQSRRFNIKYKYLEPNYETNEPFAYDFVHTVNGTACAIPRMLIAIGENYQESNSQILIPDALKPYMNGIELIKYKRRVLRKKSTVG